MDQLTGRRGVSEINAMAWVTGASWMSGVLLIPSAVAASLCYWQVQRMRWKVRYAVR